ncbi:hypothetical protein [Microcoleus sp.]|uniref:hypothetical protein n=1 Tax=Microcoleus sp. TaxID=44472 RepID=UPI003C76E188
MTIGDGGLLRGLEGGWMGRSFRISMSLGMRSHFQPTILPMFPSPSLPVTQGLNFCGRDSTICYYIV